MAATAVGNIHVGLRVDTGGARAFTSAAGVIARDSDRIRASLGGTSRSVQSLRNTMSQGWRSRFFSDAIRQASQTNNEVAKLRASMMALTAVTGTSITGAFAGTFLLQTADLSNRLNNQLRTTTENEENLIAVRKRLYDVSQLTRSDMEASVTLYSRITRAAREFGKSQDEIIRITETIQKAFAVGGASQQEAQGAAIQLSQGIASDRFSGDEYRSVAENAPVLLQNMAKHLGVTIGKLREMAHAGQLTGKVVTEAILGASDAIDRDFNKTIVTVGQGMTRLGNAFLMYIGETDASVGVTRRLSEALSNLAENFDKIAPWISGGALVGMSALLGRGGSSIAHGLGAATFGRIAASRAGAEEALKLARSEQAIIAKSIADNNALMVSQQRRHAAAYAAATKEGATQAQILAAQRRQAAAHTAIIRLRQQSVLLAGQEAAAANATAVAAARSAGTRTLMGGAMTLGRGLAGGVLGLLGGPVGVGLTAAAAGFMAASTAAAATTEKVEKLKNEMFALGRISEEAAGKIDVTTKSLSELGADQLRAKIADMREVLNLQLDGQSWWNRVPGMGWDDDNFGNIVNDVTELRKFLQDPLKGEGDWHAPGRGFTQADLPILREIERLADLARRGRVTTEELNASMDKVTRSTVGASDQAMQLATRFRLSSEFVTALVSSTSELESRLLVISGLGLPDWASGAASEAVKWVDFAAGYVAAQEAVSGIANEQERVLRLTEEQAAVEKKVADLRDKAIKAGTDASKINESDLAAHAERLVALEKQIKAQDDYNKQVKDFKSQIDDAAKSFDDLRAAADIKVLLDEFSKGGMSIKDMQDRLEAIGKQNLSNPMTALIEKIMSAVAGLSQLLGIFNSFHVGGTGNLPPVYSRDAVERNRAGQEAAARMLVRNAFEVSGRSDEETFKADYVARMRKEFEAAGLAGDSLNQILNDGASAAWNQKLSMDASAASTKSGADAAKKYAEGMAELRREAAAAPLDPFLKEVLSAAESMGIATDELDAFIAAVNSGGLDAAPGKFRDIAAAIQEASYATTLASLEEERRMIGLNKVDTKIYEVLRDTGLEYNSVQGQILADNIRLNSTMQEAADLAQRMSSMVADSLTDLFVGLIDGSKSAGDAIADLLGQLGRLLINQAFQSLFSGSAFGGGGGVGGGRGGGLLGGMIIPGILHSGGIAGTHGYGHGRAFPASTWSSALRYHNGGIAGLKPNEVPAILERGERVIPANQNLTSNNRGGDLHLHINGSGLSEEQLGRAIAEGIRDYHGALAPKVEAKFRQMQNDPRAADGGW